MLAPRARRNGAPSAPMAGASARPLSFTVRRPTAMRVVALICAILAAALAILAAFTIVQVIHQRTDGEAIYAALFLVCLAAPFALAAAALSLLYRRKWPRLQIVGSLGTVALVVLVGLWCRSVL